MITDETGKQFTYDAWNRLVAVKSAGNVTLETNGYDATNRRVTTTAGGTTTNLLYSAQWQVLEEQVSGHYTERYDWSPIYVDAMIDRDADASGTGLTAAGGNFTRLWPMQDANYDAVALGNATGAVVERYDYTPYGVVTTYSPNYGTVRAASSYDWQYEFQGLRRDEATGLYYARNRDLSPTLGRPIESDPLGLRPDVNSYRWECGSPTVLVDPSGLAPAIDQYYKPDPKGTLELNASFPAGTGEKIRLMYMALMAEAVYAIDKAIKDLDDLEKNIGNALTPTQKETEALLGYWFSNGTCPVTKKMVGTVRETIQMTKENMTAGKGRVQFFDRVLAPNEDPDKVLALGGGDGTLSGIQVNTPAIMKRAPLERIVTILHEFTHTIKGPKATKDPGRPILNQAPGNKNCNYEDPDTDKPVCLTCTQLLLNAYLYEGFLTKYISITLPQAKI